MKEKIVSLFIFCLLSFSGFIIAGAILSGFFKKYTKKG